MNLIHTLNRFTLLLLLTRNIFERLNIAYLTGLILLYAQSHLFWGERENKGSLRFSLFYDAIKGVSTKILFLPIKGIFRPSCCSNGYTLYETLIETWCF